MSLKVKHLNADSSFFLTFSPHCTASTAVAATSFSILVDPWLVGPSTIFSSKFAITSHTSESCVQSLAELPEPDVVLISQDKSDHCHEGTLRTLSPNTRARIIGTSAAARRIKSWKHFDARRIESLKRFDRNKPDTICRIELPPVEAGGSAGELTIALLAAKVDLTGLHNAIAITYQPPSNNNGKAGKTIFPISPPTTPPTSPGLVGANRAAPPFDPSKKEKKLSIIYSPHGVNDYESIIKPYAASYMESERALPLDLLVHCIDRASNPWYFGGNITTGSPDGIRIARSLRARTWIGAHDEDKECGGISVKGMTIKKFALDCVREELSRGEGSDVHPFTPSVDTAAKGSTERSSSVGLGGITKVLDLQPGEEYIVSAQQLSV